MKQIKNGEDYTTNEIQNETTKFNLDEANDNLSDCLARIRQRSMQWSI